MQIVYNAPTEVKPFDIDKFHKSLNHYGKVSKKDIEKALEQLHYDPMHYSVLVELGVKLLPDDESARDYYEDHKNPTERFERLRRITGYLVGSLERWNDGKKAEEQDRVKHGVCLEDENQYSVTNKALLEDKKLQARPLEEDEYRKGL